MTRRIAAVELLVGRGVQALTLPAGAAVIGTPTLVRKGDWRSTTLFWEVDDEAPDEVLTVLPLTTGDEVPEGFEWLTTAHGDIHTYHLYLDTRET